MKYSLAAIPLIAGIIFLYAWMSRARSEEHQQFERNVRKVQLLDATLNQDLLKNRLTLLENYDRLPSHLNEMRNTVQELSHIPGYIQEPVQGLIASKISQIEALLGEKEQLQERFKSQNAVLNNSLSYLSKGGSDALRGSASRQTDAELHDLLDPALRQVFVFGFKCSPENKADLENALNALTEWRDRNPQHQSATEVRNLATHVKSILTRAPEVDALLSKLVSVPITPLAEEALDAYYAAFGKAMASAEQMRFALYCLCGLLAAGIAYALFALNLSNRNLEKRVSERTSALSRKNEELQTEIAERQQAEKRLAEQERRIRTILDSEPECVKLIAPDGSLLEMNPAGLEMIEVDRLDAVVGQKVLGIVHPKYRAAFQELHEAVCRGESRTLQFQIVGMKGTTRWLETHACPLRNAENEIIAHLGVTRDISVQKQGEAQLAYERHLLRTLMENCPDQIYFKDLDSRFIQCSRALVERFQAASADELVGKTDADFFGAAHAREALEDEAQIIRTGVPIVAKIEREVWKDNPGKVTWALTTKMPLRDCDGVIIGTIGISKDISAIKEAEMKVEEANKQLLQTSRQAGMAEVATSVLHNVGNVLNSVNVSCSVISSTVRQSSTELVVKIAELFRERAENLGEFLTSDQRGQKIPEFLGKVADRITKEQSTVIEELTQLTEHIGHIKEIVAMQQSYGKISGVTELVHVTELVEDSLRMNAGALTRHEVKAMRDFSEVPQISVEKHKVLQILVNLIRNAKYACDESGRSDKQMILRVAGANDRVRISVIDNGIGIRAENLTKIFNHGFTTRKDGHGFGLHSAALAAQELGGRLSVHSDGEGKGAAFTLELPLQSPVHN